MGGRGSRRCATGRSAQATIEFAFVAPLFFLCFFAAIDAGLWAIQTSASVSAAEQAARLAAAAATSPESEATPSPQVLFEAIRNQLQRALFGTPLRRLVYASQATAAMDARYPARRGTLSGRSTVPTGGRTPC
jgi:Flp pilus assembly protein TadG